MMHPPLLAALVVLAPSAWAQKQAPRNSAPPPMNAEQRAALKAGGFDSKLISASALPGDPAQREAFLQENKEAYDRFVAWRQDPDLMFEAERTEPGSARAELARMEAFANPEELGLLRTRLLLAPRGVSAAVPESTGFEGRAQESAHPSAVAGTSAGGGKGAAAPAATLPGLRTNSPPTPPKLAPPPDKAQEGWSLDEGFEWLCQKVPCRW